MWMLLFQFAPSIYSFFKGEYSAYRTDPDLYKSNVQGKFETAKQNAQYHAENVREGANNLYENLSAAEKQKIMDAVKGGQYGEAREMLGKAFSTKGAQANLILDGLSTEQLSMIEQTIGTKRLNDMFKDIREVKIAGTTVTEALPLEKLPAEMRQRVMDIQSGNIKMGDAAGATAATTGGSQSTNAGDAKVNRSTTAELAQQAQTDGGSRATNPAAEVQGTAASQTASGGNLGFRAGLINRGADGTVNIGQRYNFSAIEEGLKSRTSTAWMANQGLANTAARTCGKALQYTGMFDAVKYGIAGFFTSDEEKKAQYYDIAAGSAKNVGIMKGFGWGASKILPLVASGVKGLTLAGRFIPGAAVVSGAFSLVTETGFAAWEAITGRAGWGKVGNAFVGNAIGTVGGFLGPVGMLGQQAYVELSKSWSEPQNVGWDTAPVAGFKAVRDFHPFSLDKAEVAHGVDMRYSKDAAVELKGMKTQGMEISTPPATTALGKAYVGALANARI